MSTLERLEATIAARRSASPDESYVARLNAKGLPKIAQKLGEESKATPYSSLAAFTSDFVAGEIEYLESLVGPGAVSMMSGSVPAVAVMRILARGFRPCAFA